MRARVVVPLLLSLAAVLGIVLGLAGPSGPGGAAAAGDGGWSAGIFSGGEGGDPAAGGAGFATAGARGGVAAENQPQPDFPVTALAPGETPPQFVVISFDGACKDELFQHYLDLGERADARFTFFLTGLCLLPEDDRTFYRPPGKPAGTSAVGFADPSLVPQRIVNLRTAYNTGHEIGTHFLGHFCDAEGVGVWDEADWRSEIEQFNAILDDWAEINRVRDPEPLPFNATVVKGGRTPCLAGIRDQMYPVFAEFGYTYDASNPGKLQWPRRNSFDLWEFPLQTIQVADYGRSTLSMDYNFLVAQNGGDIEADRATCDRIRESTYQSYMDALDAVHAGNRAPFFIGNHFNDWVCGAYTDALTRFVEEAHAKYPDVQFVTNVDLEKWLLAQDRKVLKQLQALPAQEY